MEISQAIGVLLIAGLLIVVSFFIMRAFLRWVFRIDEAVELLKEIRNILKK